MLLLLTAICNDNINAMKVNNTFAISCDMYNREPTPFVSES